MDWCLCAVKWQYWWAGVAVNGFQNWRPLQQWEISGHSNVMPHMWPPTTVLNNGVLISIFLHQMSNAHIVHCARSLHVTPNTRVQKFWSWNLLHPPQRYTLKQNKKRKYCFWMLFPTLLSILCTRLMKWKHAEVMSVHPNVFVSNLLHEFQWKLIFWIYIKKG
jgi:hypothetical protein